MIFFALPAYNESENLAPLLGRIESVMRQTGEPYLFIAVNDGSTDTTLQLLQELAGQLPLEIINHPRNMNLGPTLRDALRGALAHAKPEDIVVTMDADNSHDPALIPEMIALAHGGKELIVASRYVRGAGEVGLAFHRRLFSRVVNVLLRTFFPITNLTDYTCGYRAYRAEILFAASRRYGNRLIEEVGFTCMAELLLKLRPLIRKAAEVPLILRYDLKRGRSKMRVARTIFRYFHLIARQAMGF